MAHFSCSFFPASRRTRRGQKTKCSQSITLVKSVFPRTKQLFEGWQRRERGGGEAGGDEVREEVFKRRTFETHEGEHRE